ncbi:MAG: hypothetical protein ACTSXC_05235, partial [Candidatus Freyarchaeota archaeon]
KLNVSPPTIVDRTSTLKSHGLIDAHERRPGYWLTAKGAKFARKLFMETTPHSSPKKLFKLFKLFKRPLRGGGRGIIT